LPMAGCSLNSFAYGWVFAKQFLPMTQSSLKKQITKWRISS
jgi:hypothetical protein